MTKPIRMLLNKTIAVIIPSYNESKQIGKVIETMPVFVDRMIVVNDASTDDTAAVVRSYILDKNMNRTDLKIKTVEKKINNSRYNLADKIVQEKNREEIKYFIPSEIENENPDHRIVLINQKKNGGVGSAIARGYKWAKDHGIDCTAVMAGDGQMNPADLEAICMPVVRGEVDYVKGNRLTHSSSWMIVPKVRFLGNSILTILTKLASGYWHISDTQCGYTSISFNALNSFKIYNIYKSYGMPNDMLVKLNIASCAIREVKIQPVYKVGEKSKMNIFKVIPCVSLLLVRLFFKRLWVKYLVRDFHPLFILYHGGLLLILAAIPFGLKILKLVLDNQNANPLTMLAFFFLFIAGFQSVLFAMWMDSQDNERLYK